MKIVFFVHRYYPSVGGVEKYIGELGKALTGMGHAVEIVAGSHDPTLPETDEHEGITIHRFPATRSPLRARAWFLRHMSLFRRADVVHVSNTHMLEYLWRMLGGLLDRRKVFLTRHGMSYIYPVPEWERRRAVRSLELAAGVVHDGLFIEKWLGVRPDCCPNQGLSPVVGDIEQVPEPPANSATFVGRLEPDSGIAIYLDGVRRLIKDHRRPFALHVYGDGSLAGELEARCHREGLPVHFHGRTADAQRFVSDSCFAFIDGRMAMQEAMARRRLVFAAYVSPLKKDYVGGEPFSPWLVPVSSAADLAERVAHYIDHAEARERLVEGGFRYAESLSWGRTAEAYLGLWRDRMATVSAPVSLWRDARMAWRLTQEAGKPKEARALGCPLPSPCGHRA